MYVSRLSFQEQQRSEQSPQEVRSKSLPCIGAGSVVSVCLGPTLSVMSLHGLCQANLFFFLSSEMIPPTFICFWISAESRNKCFVVKQQNEMFFQRAAADHVPAWTTGWLHPEKPDGGCWSLRAKESCNTEWVASGPGGCSPQIQGCLKRPWENGGERKLGIHA